MPATIHITGNHLTFSELSDVVYHLKSVVLAQSAASQMEKSRSHIQQVLQSGVAAYGISTGFGVLSQVRIPPEKLGELQVNLLRSHAVGVGSFHRSADVRAMLLLRLNTLAKGYSGVRPDVANALASFLNHHIHPRVPQKGSVGASGDLAPMAHLALPLIGEGEVEYEGTIMPAQQALEACGLKPLVLAPKEGLSLINGTQQMTAVGALALWEAMHLGELADCIAAASLEGILGSLQPFEAWVHEARPHSTQAEVAARVRSFTEKSALMESHRNCTRVQDPYSFRCIPQVHGACWSLLRYAENMLSIEMNSATDNPLCNPDTGELRCNGHFHGQPIAMALDVLAMAVSEWGSISERRLAKLLDPGFSGLPTFLISHEGLQSGFMMVQTTAASLVSENKLLSHPASVDSIPTNNEKEDHVSMGPLAALKLTSIVENTKTILAIEALAACQALDLRSPIAGGPGAQWLYQQVRARVPFLAQDRIMSGDIARIAHFLGEDATWSQFQATFHKNPSLFSITSAVS